MTTARCRSGDAGCNYHPVSKYHDSNAKAGELDGFVAHGDLLLEPRHDSSHPQDSQQLRQSEKFDYSDDLRGREKDVS